MCLKFVFASSQRRLYELDEESNLRGSRRILVPVLHLRKRSRPGVQVT